MVDIASQLISLLKDLQNTQASAVLTMTDETGLPGGVAPGDELKATVVGRLSDLYLIQVDNRLIRARTQLPLQMGDGLRLRVMDNNTPATVRVLEHLPQQPQPSAGSGVKTFMALKSALFHVSPQIESLLENISTRGASISNLPERIQHVVSALNVLAQGDTPQPDKIRALFSMFALDVPNTLALDTASNSTIFTQILREGLDVIQEQMPFLKTSSTPSAVMMNTPSHSDSTYSNSPQAVHVQDSPALGKSGGMQVPLSAAGNAWSSAEPVPFMSTNAAAVETGLKADLQSTVQLKADLQLSNPLASDPVVPGPSLTQAQAESKGGGLAVRPVWLYDDASVQHNGVQQGVLPRAISLNTQAFSQNSQANTFQEIFISPGAQQSAIHVSTQTAIQAQGQVKGQGQAPETQVTLNPSSLGTPVTAQADLQVTDSSAHTQNIQTVPIRQTMGMPLNHDVEMAETESPKTATVHQSDSFNDIQGVQREIGGRASAQSQAVSSNTARAVSQDGMMSVRFEQSATIADEQAFGVVSTTAHGQETDVRVALHTMNLLAQHMDRMQAFRLELQQQTGMNFWFVPLWFNGDRGSGHMIWWQDKEDERKNGDSKGGFGYNLIFDLQLSRLGSLKIRLSCSEKTVQCSVAAAKEVLPVIRSGIEELRARLDSVGFSMRLAELSALSGLESKAFDPLGGSLTAISGVLNIVA